MAGKEDTQIGIGKTDGFRYIGIRPPLSAKEIDILGEEGLDISSVELVRKAPMHSLIDLGEVFAYPSQEFPHESARAIADVLGRLRRHSVKISPKEVDISYGHSELIFES